MIQKKNYLSFTVIFVCSLLLSALGVVAGTLVAQAHGGDITKIHACVKNSNGSVRIVGVNDACNNNETALDWSIGGGSSGSTALNCTGCSVKDILYRLNASTFVNANLESAILSFAFFSNQNFTGATLIRGVFYAANANDLNLTNANLNDANFNSAQLNRANLSGVTSTDTDFRSTRFVDATATGATFTRPNFLNVDMTRASFTNSTFTDPNFTDANLIDAHFTGSTITNPTWQNTLCPDGTNSNDNGGTCNGHFLP